MWSRRGFHYALILLARVCVA
jgi:hypothetical protein